MAASYKIREVRVEVQPGVVIVAETPDLASLKVFLKDISSEKFAVSDRTQTLKDGQRDEGVRLGDDPASRVETAAGLSPGTLASKKVLAFKNEVPQLLRPGVFPKTTDAVLVLLVAVETGLRTSSIDYDAFKGLYEAQNIKCGSPFSMLLSNLRQAGYLDKAAYSKNKSLRLTAKGQRKAIEALSAVCSK